MKKINSVSIRMAVHSFILYSSFAVVNSHISILLFLNGISSKFIGLLMSVYFISGLFGPVTISKIIQRNHRYRLFFFLVPILSAAIGGLLGMTSNTLLLSALMFTFGFLFNSFAPLSDATLMHVLDNPYKTYGLIRSMGTLGFVFASVVFAVFPIIDLNDKHTISNTIVAIIMVISVASFLVPVKGVNKDYGHSQGGIMVALRSFPLAYYIILIFLFFNFMGIATVSVYLPLYVKLVFNLQNATSVWILATLSEFIGLIWGQRIISRLGYFMSFVVVIASTMIRILILAMFHNVVIVYLSQLLHVFSFAFCLSAMIHFVHHHIANIHKPIALSIQQGVIALSRVCAAILGGWLLDAYSFTVMYWVVAGMLFIGLVTVFVFMNKVNVPIYKSVQ